MITLTSQRMNFNADVPAVQTLDVIAALHNLAYWDCDWTFTNCDRIDDLIVIEVTAPIFGDVIDVRTFQGQTEEMLPLVRFLPLYLSRRKTSVISDEACANARELLGDEADRSYAHVLLEFHPNVTRIAFLAAAGVTEKDDIDLAFDYRNDDIVAALQLCRDSSCTFREALSL